MTEKRNRFCTTEEVRHLLSIAKHIEPYAQRMHGSMSSLLDLPLVDNYWPYQNAVSNFQRDMGTGIIDLSLAISRVLKDMLPQVLEEGDTIHLLEDVEYLVHKQIGTNLVTLIPAFRKE